LTEQAWQVKDLLLIWKKKTICLWDTAGNPEQARQCHLELPAQVANHSAG